MLGLRFCARAFSSCGKWGPLFITVRGPLTIVASLVVEHRLQMRRLSSCGSRDQLLCSMWDLPRPGLEPVSPALAGRFSTTAPPGKPPSYFVLGNRDLRTSRNELLPLRFQCLLKGEDCAACPARWRDSGHLAVRSQGGLARQAAAWPPSTSFVHTVPAPEK